MFRLILGLSRPQTGRVYLETDCGEVDCGAATRELIAYVPQDYALFSGTILENLRLAAPSASLEQCRRALEIAQADFVWSLPKRELSQVWERNGGLSMGQLQRLAVARAVLMDRPILLLDECTSALDIGTERALLLELRKLGQGVLLASHRLESLEWMAHIWKMDGEEIE